MLIALAHVLAAVFLGWLAGRVWTGILGRITRRAGKELDQRLVTISRKPVAVLAFILFLQVAREKLSQFPQWAGSPVFDWMTELSFLVAVVAAALWVNAVLGTIIDWYLSSLARQSQNPLSDVFLPLFRKVLILVTLFIAFTIVLSHFGIEITALIATAGVASLAIALAAQDTLTNMLAGFMILSDRPFKEGDRIELESGLHGDVLQIGIRSTKIMTRDNLLVVVPNREIANAFIFNHTLSDPRLRLRIPVGVAYGTDLHHAKEIILEVLARNEYVLPEPAPVVYFTEFGDSSLNLLIRCWIGNAVDRSRAIDSINMAVKDAFEAHGIEIPFPQRDLHLKTPVAFLREPPVYRRPQP